MFPCQGCKHYLLILMTPAWGRWRLASPAVEKDKTLVSTPKRLCHSLFLLRNILLYLVTFSLSISIRLFMFACFTISTSDLTPKLRMLKLWGQMQDKTWCPQILKQQFKVEHASWSKRNAKLRLTRCSSPRWSFLCYKDSSQFLPSSPIDMQNT